MLSQKLNPWRCTFCTWSNARQRFRSLKRKPSETDEYAEGKYYLPYRKSASNIGFDGLNWNPAKYLYPISNYEFRMTTEVEGSNDYDTSSIYQNPGWSKEDGTLPEGD